MKKGPIVKTKEDSEGRRNVKMERRFSDKSKETEIIDMIEALENQGWNMSGIVKAAFDALLPLWRESQGKLAPIPVRTDAMTLEMRNLLQQAKSLNALTIQALQGIHLGQNSVVLQSQLKELNENIEMFSILESAGNNGSELLEPEDDSQEWGEW